MTNYNDELHTEIWKQLHLDGLVHEVDTHSLVDILVELYERVNALEKRLEWNENYEEEQDV